MDGVSKNVRGKPKGVIVYLADKVFRHRVKRLKYSLSLLQQNFNERYRYPVVIFHEDYGEKEKAYLLKNFNASITFVQLKGFLDLPNELSQAQVDRWIEGRDGGRAGAHLGYRQMCRFYSYPMLVHEALSEFDYYWRFDDDSFLIEKLTYDPFARMETQGAVYGYVAKAKENHMTKNIGFKKLLNVTKKFARGNKISLKGLTKEGVINFWKGYRGSYIYNNFEVNKISFWRDHKRSKEFFESLDACQGFQKYRWGDGNVRTFMIFLFLEMDQIYHFDDIPYRHNYHYAIPKSEDIAFHNDGLTGDQTFEEEKNFCLNPEVY